MSLEDKVRTPVVDYKSITINGVNILLSSTAKASFIDPYNKIIIKYSPDISLSQFLVRVTVEDDDYDVDLGVKAAWQTNIAAAEEKTATVDVNTTNFTKGDGTYRVGLYAQSMIDNSWDVTYLLFSVDGIQFEPKDADGYEVLTTKEVTD